MNTCDIIMPTWKNLPYLVPCLNSIFQNTPDGMYKVILVNNGDPEDMNGFKIDSHLEILQQPKNMGWEGGLIAGLEKSTAPFVMFMNDDTYIPHSSKDWLEKLLKHFDDPAVSAVGPSSNVVMGNQNIFLSIKECVLKVKFLIGFCMLIQKSDLDSSGGVDASLPGGDDLDLSIRLRDLGKQLLVDRDVFVYHHGFKTGERLQGGPHTPGGWNSIEMLEKTNDALINKHGLVKFLDLWSPYGL